VKRETFPFKRGFSIIKYFPFHGRASAATLQFPRLLRFPASPQRAPTTIPPCLSLIPPALFSSVTRRPAYRGSPGPPRRSHFRLHDVLKGKELTPPFRPEKSTRNDPAYLRHPRCTPLISHGGSADSFLSPRFPLTFVRSCARFPPLAVAAALSGNISPLLRKVSTRERKSRQSEAADRRN